MKFFVLIALFCVFTTSKVFGGKQDSEDFDVDINAEIQAISANIQKTAQAQQNSFVFLKCTDDKAPLFSLTYDNAKDSSHLLVVENVKRDQSLYLNVFHFPTVLEQIKQYNTRFEEHKITDKVSIELRHATMMLIATEAIEISPIFFEDCFKKKKNGEVLLNVWMTFDKLKKLKNINKKNCAAILGWTDELSHMSPIAIADLIGGGAGGGAMTNLDAPLANNQHILVKCGSRGQRSAHIRNLLKPIRPDDDETQGYVKPPKKDSSSSSGVMEVLRNPWVLGGTLVVCIVIIIVIVFVLKRKYFSGSASTADDDFTVATPRKLRK